MIARLPAERAFKQSMGEPGDFERRGIKEAVAVRRASLPWKNGNLAGSERPQGAKIHAGAADVSIVLDVAIQYVFGPPLRRFGTVPQDADRKDTVVRNPVS
jgi:hypothetical protein